jgi:hypothetical protein
MSQQKELTSQNKSKRSEYKKYNSPSHPAVDDHTVHIISSLIDQRRRPKNHLLIELYLNFSIGLLKAAIVVYEGHAETSSILLGAHYFGIQVSTL